MQRIIYHGSDHQITAPEYGKGKVNNDYGRGFYCTEDPELAQEWAVQDRMDGYANCYTIDDTDMRVLNLNADGFSALHWLEILISNRTFDLTTPLSREAARYLHENFHVDTDEADVITGYRADDSYFTFAQDFLNGSISVGQLSDVLRLGKLGNQYVLKSRKAFDTLQFEKTILAASEIWYPKKCTRDRNARREYYSMDTMKYIKNDLYMIQIIDQEVKADDLRIR